MVTAILVVLTIFGVCAVALMVAASELERRHERWEQFRHPPDSTLEDDDDE